VIQFDTSGTLNEFMYPIKINLNAAFQTQQVYLFTYTLGLIEGYKELSIEVCGDESVSLVSSAVE
jgi:hypothetical protein